MKQPEPTAFDPDCVRLGAIVREFRVMRGMTQDQLATEARISRAHLANLEAGRRAASGRAISRIATALAVPQITLVRAGRVNAA